MRTHAEIVHTVTVPALRRVLADRGFEVPDATVRSWARRPAGKGSIPGAYWRVLADANIATLEELSQAALQLAAEQAA